MKADVSEASPAKAILGELERIRAAFREAMEVYAGRIEAEIAQVRETIEAERSAAKVPSSKLRDMRDMLTLLRKAEIKTDKGRRKDLKRIDGVVGDLRMLIENW